MKGIKKSFTRFVRRNLFMSFAALVIGIAPVSYYLGALVTSLRAELKLTAAQLERAEKILLEDRQAYDASITALDDEIASLSTKYAALAAERHAFFKELRHLNDRNAATFEASIAGFLKPYVERVEVLSGQLQENVVRVTELTSQISSVETEADKDRSEILAVSRRIDQNVLDIAVARSDQVSLVTGLQTSVHQLGSDVSDLWSRFQQIEAASYREMKSIEIAVAQIKNVTEEVIQTVGNDALNDKVGPVLGSWESLRGIEQRP